jgi:hypothetical protein
MLSTDWMAEAVRAYTSAEADAVEARLRGLGYLE